MASGSHCPSVLAPSHQRALVSGLLLKLTHRASAQASSPDATLHAPKQAGAAVFALLDYIRHRHVKPVRPFQRIRLPRPLAVPKRYVARPSGKWAPWVMRRNSNAGKRTILPTGETSLLDTVVPFKHSKGCELAFTEARFVAEAQSIELALQSGRRLSRLTISKHNSQ